MLMKMIADLHIHSRFSMATSKEGTPENLDFWARKKGISLIGTGDFTHPVWREELKERLVSEGNGLYRLRDAYVKEEVACVVFNLGYLPRAKHIIITKPDTTLEAIKKSLKLLKPNGIISIAAYIGHEGGLEEKNYICEYLDNLNQNEFNVLHMQFTNQINNPPQLILIEKKGDIINS